MTPSHRPHGEERALAHASNHAEFAAHPSRRAPDGALLGKRTGRCDYLSLIGSAVFSAGAGGNAVGAPAFCASSSGRAGSGGVPVGRAPVVAGSAGADGLVSAPGVDCRGWVACAICGWWAASRAAERPNIVSPAATIADASSISFLKARFLSSEDISFTAYRWRDQRPAECIVPGEIQQTSGLRGRVRWSRAARRTPPRTDGQSLNHR
jgi:hypothetical protein